MEDVTSSHIEGYVQQINAVPFSIHLYSEEQLKAYDLSQNLYFDATGTICTWTT